MARQSNVKVESERNPSSRDPEKRVQPFASVLLTALVVVPAFCLVLRVIVGFGGDSLKWLIVWLSLLLFGTILPGVAIAVGYRVTKRTPFVIWHVAITTHLFAIAVSLSVLPGWNHVSAGHHWWDDVSAWLANVFLLPGPVVVLYLFGAVSVSLSWLLYRIDAFRAATDGEGKDTSKLAELVGWPKGATIRAGTIEADEFSVTAVVDHPGVPIAKIQSTVPALEEHGFVRGRSSVIGEAKGGVSKMRFVHSDPLKTWRTWPGPSHPGDTFAAPFRTAYYSTGELQWYGFAKTPDEFRSRLVPSFVVPNDAHFGRQGATRSGKSGDIAQEICEAATRRDCAFILVNLAKLRQDSGWALDFAELAADTKARARNLMAGLRRVGEYRSDIMGDLRYEGRHRTWTEETYDELGFAALLIEVDEGDLVLSGSDVTWLSTKGLSLGIYLSVSISRAATDGMASTLRSAVSQWKAFGCGQDYDAGFVLTDETMAAGADPHTFGIEFPGAHYADRLQGVDHRLYPVDARSFKTTRTFSDLRQAVEAARATFPTPHLTPGEIEAFGQAEYESCLPQTILFGARDKDENMTDSDKPGRSPAPDDEGDDEMPLLNFDDHLDSGDPELDEVWEMPTDTSDVTREFGPIDPRTPLPTSDTPSTIDYPQVKPMVGPAETVAEFDAALIRMADRGVREFDPADVMEEMKVAMRPSRCSERFRALCDDETLNPPGLIIERIGGRRGGHRYMLVRTDGPTRTHRA
jgi:hypothetical protein